MSTRLDNHLVTLGLVPTRARAADAIARGCVRVDGVIATKAGQKVADGAAVALQDPASAYVSRAALKLVAGLDLAGLDVSGRECLDVGASTGGFTQVLLERGAVRVTALDVGTDQLHASLRDDPRVVELKANARDLVADMLPGPPSLAVCDVSFISLRLAMPPALDAVTPGGRCVLLVKPQFEIGRGGVGKGGVVDPAEAERVAGAMRDWLDGRPGWRSTHLAPSPIHGGDGNREWLLIGARHEDADHRGPEPRR